MLEVYVDADACPVKREVGKVAGRYALNVTYVSNAAMRVPREWNGKLVVVDAGQLDAADDWIVQHAVRDDIVVTTDILLASRCVKLGAQVLAPTGHVFSEDNIGQAVATRELMRALREDGSITGGPPPFQKEDRSNFLQNFDQIVQNIKRSDRANAK
jgi:hypothetical protein